MSDENLQEWEECDARMLDDSTVIRAAPAAQQPTLEGPFLLSNHGEIATETENLFGLERIRAAQDEVESAMSGFGRQTWTETLNEANKQESLVDEVSGKSWRADSLDFDPYASIRSAMSPEHASAAPNEVTLILGRMPATFVLHQFLNSAEMRKATLASLLGKAARRSVRVNASGIPIPTYLRLVSHLCREVAEQGEREFKDDTAGGESPLRQQFIVGEGTNTLNSVDPVPLIEHDRPCLPHLISTDNLPSPVQQKLNAFRDSMVPSYHIPAEGGLGERDIRVSPFGAISRRTAPQGRQACLGRREIEEWPPRRKGDFLCPMETYKNGESTTPGCWMILR
jgi:hypothetical protein